MVGETLLKKLAREVDESLAEKLWGRIDIVGDIAVVKIPFNTPVDWGKVERLGKLLLDRLPYVKSVWAIVSPTTGSYKVRGLRHVAGEERTETVYREHGCRFMVDIAKVFITPRLNFEHARIASLISEGEVVVNMFAGAGLFSIIAACKSKPRKVYSIDINPAAYEYMKINARLNRVEDVVEPILGDAARVVSERLRGVADRVIMPLPELALRYLYYAITALKARGWIHVYLHVRGRGRREALRLAEQAVVEEALRSGARNVRVAGSRRVRSVGPRTLQVVVDVEVEK